MSTGPRARKNDGDDADAIRSSVDRLRDLREGPGALADVVACGAAAIPALEELLRGPSDVVDQPRCLAADALAIIGGPRAADVLIAALVDSASRALDPVREHVEYVVANAIAEALGAVADPRAADALMATLRARAYPGCVAALDRLGSSSAVPLLVERVHADVTREPAIDALRTHGSSVLPALAEALTQAASGEGARRAERIAGRELRDAAAKLALVAEPKRADARNVARLLPGESPSMLIAALIGHQPRRRTQRAS